MSDSAKFMLFIIMICALSTCGSQMKQANALENISEQLESINEREKKKEEQKEITPVDPEPEKIINGQGETYPADP